MVFWDVAGRAQGTAETVQKVNESSRDTCQSYGPPHVKPVEKHKVGVMLSESIMEDASALTCDALATCTEVLGAG